MPLSWDTQVIVDSPMDRPFIYPSKHSFIQKAVLKALCVGRGTGTSQAQSGYSFCPLGLCRKVDLGKNSHDIL